MIVATGGFMAGNLAAVLAMDRNVRRPSRPLVVLSRSTVCASCHTFWFPPDD